ncbi:MAG: hypothetical protein R2860_01640 [Desulfobacterales bacterium]
MDHHIPGRKIHLSFEGKKHRAENINAGLIATGYPAHGKSERHMTTDTGEKIISKTAPAGIKIDIFPKW